MVLTEYVSSLELIKIKENNLENIQLLLNEKDDLERSEYVVINDRQYKISNVHITEKHNKVMLVTNIETINLDYLEVVHK